MLIAGASADNTPAIGGALAFSVDNPPSSAWWGNGSAFIYLMLLAGAGAVYTPAVGGAFPFNAGVSPSNAWWGNGSAY